MNSLNTISTSVDLGRGTISCYLDLSAAFECVDLTRMLSKLSDLGVRGVPLNWIQTFLSGRKQYVEVLGEVTKDNVEGAIGGFTLLRSHKKWPFGAIFALFKSEIAETLAGVGQGTVLGAPLYLLYVNDILRSCETELPAIEKINDLKQIMKVTPIYKSLSMYADDTSSVISSTSLENSISQSQSLIEHLRIAFATHGLLLNEDKTGILVFRPRSQFTPTTLKIASSAIESSPAIKFLGVTIDYQLSWKPQIAQLLKKLSSSIFVIKRMAKLGSNLAILAYHAIFYSHMAYGIEVWGGSSHTLINEILLLQKRAVRYILKLPPRASCRQGFKELKFITVFGLYVFKILIYGKILMDNGKLRLNSDNHGYLTRQASCPSVTQGRTQMADTAPVNMAIRLLNILPPETKLLPLRKFKLLICEKLTERSAYSLNEAMNILVT